MTDQTWFNLTESGEYLRLSPSYVRQLVRENRIEYTRTNSQRPLSQLRFRRDWLDSYLERNASNANTNDEATKAEIKSRERR